MPPLQTIPVVHACPHAPQFAVSVIVSAQRSPQTICPTGQTHAPSSHDWPIKHASEHPPQFAESLAMSTQAPAQFVSFDEQETSSEPSGSIASSTGDASSMIASSVASSWRVVSDESVVSTCSGMNHTSLVLTSAGAFAAWQ
jgi:hypothetical protein